MKAPWWSVLLLLVVAAAYLCTMSRELRSLQQRLLQAAAGLPEAPLPAVERDLECLAGVITVEPGGRLANQIFELLSAWAVAEDLGLQLRVPEEILALLQGTYRNLGALRSLEGELLHGECRGRALNTSFVFQHALHEAFERDVRPYVAWAARMRQPLVLRKWVVHLESIVPRLEQIRKEWRAWLVIEETVHAEMNKMRDTVRFKFGNKTVELVSVHVRRGDYEGLLKNKWNVTTTADVPYFRRAVQRMRHVLEHREVAVGFVVVSDDPEWCQDVLIPALQLDLQEGLPPAQVFESPFWWHPSPAYDLQLLSSCDHSILSYGTFGLWGAIKAGGHTIVYDMLNAGNPDARVPNFVSDLRLWFPAWELLV